MSYRTQMQRITAGNQFDGTLPTGTPVSFKGKRVFTAQAAGGLFELAPIDPGHLMGVSIFGESGFPLAGTKATNTLTGTTIADGETVTIGGRVYTFEGTLGAIDDVQFNASEQICIDNLIAAINQTGTDGVEYFAGTVINADVSAAAGGAFELDATALRGGTIGNAITTTDNFTAGGWATATLEGGLDDGTIAIIRVTFEADEFNLLTDTGSGEFVTDASQRFLMLPNEKIKIVTTNMVEAMTCMLSTDFDLSGGSHG